EQAGVLDGDDGLGGEHVQERDLLMRERPHLHPADQNCSYWNSFSQQRNGKRGFMAELLGVNPSFRENAPTVLQGRDVDAGPSTDGSPCYPVAIYRAYGSDRPLPR